MLVLSQMPRLNDKKFKALVSEAIDAVPPLYQQFLKDVAFIVEDKPLPEQLRALNLRDDASLFGLYEGVPLPKRGGQTKILPDKITIFKEALEQHSRNLSDLRDQVAHTVWHEVAHYYGLDHQKISELENKALKNLIEKEKEPDRF